MSHLTQWVPAREIGVSKVMFVGLLVGIFIRLIHIYREVIPKIPS
jgi:hypothetical protein